MRKWVSALAVIAALCYAAPALADDPASVYSDFAADGVLNCGHSRSALNGVLNDASLYQYGDPLTMLELKLAIRRQLAGGCRSHARASVILEPAGGGSAESQNSSRGHAKRKATRGAKPPTSTFTSAAPKAAGGGSVGDGPMELAAVGLLLLALASAGWAARRAFTDRR